jgi:hypothetical protein
MTIIKEIKFLVWRYFVINVCVSLPFLIFLAQVSRFFVEQESQTYVEITLDIQAVVALIMVIAGVVIKDADYTLFNWPIMLILNITAGVLGLILTLSTLKKYMNPTVYFLAEVLFSLVSLLFLFLSWCWYYDTLELKDKTKEK